MNLLPTRSPAPGFSLIELIIAVAVIGFIALGAAQLFSGLTRGQKSVSNQGEVSRRESFLQMTFSKPSTCTSAVSSILPASSKQYDIGGTNPAIASMALSGSTLFDTAATSNGFAVASAKLASGTLQNTWTAGTETHDLVLTRLLLRISVSQGAPVERQLPVQLDILRSGATPGSGTIVGCEPASSQEKVTDWMNAGPMQITAETTAPTKGPTTQDAVLWRRVGDSMELRWTYVQTAAGTNGSGAYLFTVPGGHAIDTAKLPTPAGAIDHRAPVGTFFRVYNNVAGGSGWGRCYGGVYAYDSRRLFVEMICSNGGSVGDGALGIYSTQRLGANLTPQTITIEARFPVDGW